MSPARRNEGPGAALAAETAREIVVHGTFAVFGRDHTHDSKLLVRYVAARGHADGSGELILHDAFAKMGLSDGGDDPDHVIASVRLDPAQFAAFMDGAMRPLDASERRR